MYGRNTTVIFTDGNCKRNGRPDAIAGIGVYCPEDTRRNFSSSIPGAQTNQRAEILAASTGIRRAIKQGFDGVLVKTDSMYVKNAFEKWIPEKWEENGWLNSKGESVANKTAFQKLYKLRHEIRIAFKWVPTDENPADELANRAIRREEQRLWSNSSSSGDYY